MNLINILSFAT